MFKLATAQKIDDKKSALLPACCNHAALGRISCISSPADVIWNMATQRSPASASVPSQPGTIWSLQSHTVGGQHATAELQYQGNSSNRLPLPLAAQLPPGRVQSACLRLGAN